MLNLKQESRASEHSFDTKCSLQVSFSSGLLKSAITQCLGLAGGMLSQLLQLYIHRTNTKEIVALIHHGK